MKTIKKVSDLGKWILTDGTMPIQMRIMTSKEITGINHLHKTMHEYFYVLEGSLKVTVAGNVQHFRKDDLLVVEPGESHYVSDKSEDLKLLLLMPPPVPGDKVVLEK